MPLLIPAILAVVAVASAFGAKAHVVHPNAFAVLVGWVVIFFAIGPPSFFAGIRFIEESRGTPPSF